MNDIGNSEEIFQKVLQTNPGLAEVHFGLGAVLWLKKDHAGAEATFARRSGSSPAY